jgi:membrane protein implicated in regulation of membrane protease activity
MEELLNSPATLWFLIGFLALIIEAVVLGMSSGLLLFGGLSALITGLLFTLGILGGGAFGIEALATFGIGSGLLTLLLWKPLKALQNRKGDMYQENNSDFVGLKFKLESDIDQNTDSSVAYSGINWKVRLDPDLNDPIPAGETVEVSRVRVGVFMVKPHHPPQG